MLVQNDFAEVRLAVHSPDGRSGRVLATTEVLAHVTVATDGAKVIAQADPEPAPQPIPDPAPYTNPDPAPVPIADPTPVPTTDLAGAPATDLVVAAAAGSADT